MRTLGSLLRRHADLLDPKGREFDLTPEEALHALDQAQERKRALRGS